MQAVSWLISWCIATFELAQATKASHDSCTGFMIRPYRPHCPAVFMMLTCNSMLLLAAMQHLKGST